MDTDCRTLASRILLAAALAVLAAGCARYTVVEIPPRIDLERYRTIGIVEFSSNSTEGLNRSATAEFMKAIQKAQPGVRFLELGPEDELLQAIDRPTLDPEAIQAIGRRYNLTSVFVGRFEISEVKPKLRLTRDLSSVNATATVSISMTSRHLDAETGATIWTNSRNGEWPVASVTKGGGQPVSISVSAPEDRYGQFILDLTYAVTDDFRVRYEKRKST